MKFLLPNGIVEEGEPLEEYAASFLVNLEAYLHDKVCRHSYHGYSESKRCQEAAQYLTMIVTTIDKSEWGEVLFEKLNPKPEPDPTPVSQVETSTISETTSQPSPEPVTESTASKDDCPF